MATSIETISCSAIKLLGLDHGVPGSHLDLVSILQLEEEAHRHVVISKRLDHVANLEFAFQFVPAVSEGGLNVRPPAAPEAMDVEEVTQEDLEAKELAWMHELSLKQTVIDS